MIALLSEKRKINYFRKKDIVNKVANKINF